MNITKKILSVVLSQEGSAPYATIFFFNFLRYSLSEVPILLHIQTNDVIQIPKDPFITNITI